MNDASRDIILVTGMSGAGKTTTMSIFEDMGYLIIDNLPSQLLVQFNELWTQEKDLPHRRIVIGVRLFEFPAFAKSIELNGINPRIVFLNCSDDELRRRYKYNRRTHPLIITNQAQTIDEAIEKEREIFGEYEAAAQITIDTTFTNKSDLIDIYEDQLNFKFYLSTRIVFQSFGYRYGLPLDADYVFDVRFLDNPYYDEDLRLLTGKDHKVRDYVLSDEKTGPFMERLIALLDDVLKESLNMDRGVINIAIGCTGGQHRSVVLANYLAAHYSSTDKALMGQNPEQKPNVGSYHRDIDKNQRDVVDRHQRKIEKIRD